MMEQPLLLFATNASQVSIPIIPAVRIVSRARVSGIAKL